MYPSGNGRLRFRRGWIGLIRPLSELSIDGTAGESVENDPTQKLWITPLNLFGLLCDVSGQSNIQLYRAGIPHVLSLSPVVESQRVYCGVG